MIFLRAAIGSRLKGSDKVLDQVLLVRKLAVRGIAIHHAGMLPLLKEVRSVTFSLLFCRRPLKCSSSAD